MPQRIHEQDHPGGDFDPQEVIARAQARPNLKPRSPRFEALVFKASRGIEDIYELTTSERWQPFPGRGLGHSIATMTPSSATAIGTDNTARKRVEAERTQLDSALHIKNSELEANALWPTRPTWPSRNFCRI